MSIICVELGTSLSTSRAFNKKHCLSKTRKQVFVVPLIPDPSIAFTLTSNHDGLYLSHNCPIQYNSKHLSAYYANYFTGYSQQKTGNRCTSACNSMAYQLGSSQENEKKGENLAV